MLEVLFVFSLLSVMVGAIVVRRTVSLRWLPLAVGGLVLLYAVVVGSRFEPNPYLEAWLKNTTLTRQQRPWRSGHSYRGRFKVDTAEFLYAGSTDWTFYNNGSANKWTGDAATFRAFLKKLPANERTNSRARTFGPVYLKVSDLSGFPTVTSVKISKAKLGLIKVQAFLSSSIVLLLHMIFVLLYGGWLVQSYFLRRPEREPEGLEMSGEAG